MTENLSNTRPTPSWPAAVRGAMPGILPDGVTEALRSRTPDVAEINPAPVCALNRQRQTTARLGPSGRRLKCFLRRFHLSRGLRSVDAEIPAGGEADPVGELNGQLDPTPRFGASRRRPGSFTGRRGYPYGLRSDDAESLAIGEADRRWTRKLSAHRDPGHRSRHRGSHVARVMTENPSQAAAAPKR